MCHTGLLYQREFPKHFSNIFWSPSWFTSTTLSPLYLFLNQPLIPWSHLLEPHTNGQFSVKSPYGQLCPNSENNSFQWLWKLQLPQKIKHLFWQMSHHRLLTASYLYNIHVTNNPLCPVCHSNDETIAHLFFECHQAKPVWQQLGLQHLNIHVQTLHEQTPLKLSCLILHNKLTTTITSSPTIICYALWHIWSSRNCLVFDNTNHPPNIQHILGQAAEYFHLGVTHRTHTNTPTYIDVKWNPPSHRMYKLNSDSVYNLTNKKRGFGGIIRDSTSKWVIGYTGTRPTKNHHYMEFTGLLEGSQLALQHKLAPLEVNVICHW